jgi:hypothetical protein
VSLCKLCAASKLSNFERYINKDSGADVEDIVPWDGELAVTQLGKSLSFTTFLVEMQMIKVLSIMYLEQENHPLLSLYSHHDTHLYQNRVYCLLVS